MYNQYIKTMNEYYTGYLESMKALKKSFVQTTDRVNEESGKSTENVSSYYHIFRGMAENGSTMDECRLGSIF